MDFEKQASDIIDDWRGTDAFGDASVTLAERVTVALRSAFEAGAESMRTEALDSLYKERDCYVHLVVLEALNNAIGAVESITFTVSSALPIPGADNE